MPTIEPMLGENEMKRVPPTQDATLKPNSLSAHQHPHPHPTNRWAKGRKGQKGQKSIVIKSFFLFNVSYRLLMLMRVANKPTHPIHLYGKFSTSSKLSDKLHRKSIPTLS